MIIVAGVAALQLGWMWRNVAQLAPMPCSTKSTLCPPTIEMKHIGAALDIVDQVIMELSIVACLGAQQPS